MKPTVFFDLDGVLVQFVAGALKLHKREDLHQRSVTWGIESQLGLTPAEFWSPLGFDFWVNLEPYRDGFGLLAAAANLVGDENIGLLTSPCDTAGCVDGKRAWVARYLPGYSRRLMVGSAKELFAGPTKILVDDHDANIQKFSAAGGRTVQPPRPWNSLSRCCCDVDGGFNVERVLAMLVQELQYAKRAI
jgi:hypothetical protein